MKKLFLLSAAALMVLASCTKDEVAQTPDQKITFSSPVIGAATKAAITGTTFPTTVDFKVYAAYTDAEFATWPNDLYMDGVVCSYDQTETVWLPEKAYYWPKNAGYLTFAAFSPSDIAGASYTSDGFVIEDDYTVADVDVLFSDRTYNKQNNTGGTIYPTDNTKEKAVDINFNHALALVAFRAKTEADYTATTKITLNEIKISKFSNIGTFAEGRNSETEDEKRTPAWTVSENDQQAGTVDISALNMELSNAYAEDYIANNTTMVMPQTIGDDAVIEIKYTMTVNNVEVECTSGPITLNTCGFDKWEVGKRHIYNISIGLTQIRFSPEITDWVDVDGESTTVTM